MTIQELRNKRANLVTEARKILDAAKQAGRDLTAEEAAQFDKMDAEIADLGKQIEAKEKAEQANAERYSRLESYQEQMRQLNTHGINLQNVAGSAAGHLPGGNAARPTDEDFAMAMQGWFLAQCPLGEPTNEHREAANRCGLNLDGKVLSLDLNSNFNTVRNALSGSSAGSGGVLRLGEFMGGLEQAMLQHGPMLDVAQIIRTAHANPLPWPTANDTTNSGRQIGEAKPVAELDPSFAATVWNAYKFTSDEILIAFELLRDASTAGAINLAQILGSMLGERLGRVQNRKFTTGTGSGTPNGIVPRSTLGKETAGATAITADELIDLQHSVPAAYRNGAAFMAHDDVFKAIRKLKDESDNYVWQPGLLNGQPDRLLNWPIHTNDDMEGTLQAGAKSMLAGQLSAYKVRQVGKVRLYRLTERHRENDQDAFLAFIEADGNLLDPGVGVVRHLLQKTG